MATRKYAPVWTGDRTGDKGTRVVLAGVSQFDGYNPATDAMRNGKRGRFQQIQAFEPEMTTRQKRTLLHAAGIRSRGGDF